MAAVRRLAEHCRTVVRCAAGRGLGTPGPPHCACHMLRLPMFIPCCPSTPLQRDPPAQQRGVCAVRQAMPAQRRVSSGAGTHAGRMPGRWTVARQWRCWALLTHTRALFFPLKSAQLCCVLRRRGSRRRLLCRGGPGCADEPQPRGPLPVSTRAVANDAARGNYTSGRHHASASGRF